MELHVKVMVDGASPPERAQYNILAEALLSAARLDGLERQQAVAIARAAGLTTAAELVDVAQPVNPYYVPSGPSLPPLPS